MSTAERPRQRTRGIRDAADTPQPADVFVVFGITGDLAKQMTLHSLYRLEARGLLSCPIVGVAVDDWTVEDLRERARQAIVASGEPLDPEVFDALQPPASPTWPATSRTRRPSSAWQRCSPRRAARSSISRSRRSCSAPS